MNSITFVNISRGFEEGIIPLGLCSISAYLKKFGGYKDISLLDSNCQDIFNQFKPTDVVGIGAVTQDIQKAVKFAEFVKSQYDIPVILGGVHISTYRKLPEPFDLGVVGEGEETMLELMRLDNFSVDNLRKVNGVCYNENGKTVFTEPRQSITDLDSIPIPDREIVNMDFYLKKRQIIPYHVGRSLTLMTSRGCPFNCAFCSTKVHWKRFRAFSADRVIEELELLIDKYKAEIIHVFDDLFIANKKRFREIHRRILEKGFQKKVKFMCLVRSDMLDDPTMKMLKEMNVVVTGIGMETGCENTLNYLKKNTTTIQMNRDAIELANKYCIPTMGSFMVGNPHETEQDLLQTLEFIRSYRYSPFLVPLPYIATPFPGTEFFDYAKSKGLDPDNFDKLVMDIPSRIDTLLEAPLLSEVPVERFFEISQVIAREGWYCAVKKHIFQPEGFLSPLKAYIMGAIAERSILKGIREVNRIKTNFRKLKGKCI